MYGIAFAIMAEQDQGRRGLAGVYPRIEGAMVYGITKDSRGDNGQIMSMWHQV